MTTFADSSHLDRWYLADAPGSWFGRAETDVVERQVPQLSPPSTTHDLDWFHPLFARMNELVSLHANWDRRGSAAVSVNALVFALTVLTKVMPPRAIAPSVVPLGHGGVQLVWRNNEAELEVEVVEPNNVILYCLDKRTGIEREWPATTDFTELSSILWKKFGS